MPFEIVRNDIANMCVDAIVNTANPKPVIGYGVDAGIHRKAGPELLEARLKELVSAGTITRTQADAILAQITECMASCDGTGCDNQGVCDGTGAGICGGTSGNGQCGIPSRGMGCGRRGR